MKLKVLKRMSWQFLIALITFIGFFGGGCLLAFFPLIFMSILFGLLLIFLVCVWYIKTVEAIKSEEQFKK